MKTIVWLFTVILTLATVSSQAQEYKLGSLKIEHPWSRATPKGASVAGAYMKITNTGTTTDRLIGGSSPIAGRFEIHQMTMANGVMQMRPLKDGIEIKPGETVELKPESLHVMLLDLKQPIHKDDHVKSTLIFEKAGSIEVEYPALGVGQTPRAGAQPESGGKGMPGMPGH